MSFLDDSFSPVDKIGHSEYKDALSKFIVEMKPNCSFTIGVYGEWGSGKTSFLKQIKTKLELDLQNDEAKPIVTVWFNPWQFIAEEHLIIPFFHTLINELDVFKDKHKSSPEVLKRITTFLNKVAHVPCALVYGMDGELKFPLVGSLKLSGSKALDEAEKLEKKIDAKADKKALVDSELLKEKYDSVYYNLMQVLEEAVQELDIKVVVFVDDLDRCLPEKALQLLEGLKVLLDVPNFIFVMGMAKEVVEQGIKHRYRRLSANERANVQRHYLDKIVQFPFALPSADPDQLRRELIEPALKEKEMGAYTDLVHEALGNNPRTVKRFINVIDFTCHLARNKEGWDFHPQLLVKICLISYLFPDLYKMLEESPFRLVRLENIVREYEEGRSSQDRDLQNKSAAEKTGLIIDRWLEGKPLDQLSAILKKRDDGRDDHAFETRETVTSYVRLIASSVQNEVDSSTHGNTVMSRSESFSKEMDKRMVHIKAGTFVMGDEEVGKREVNLTHDFLVDKYPVTQSLYERVMGENPSHFKGEDRPVEQVSWRDAVKFCNALSQLCGRDNFYDILEDNVERIGGANGFRLLTEAEWEFACRAGTTEDRYASNLDEIAWYEGNSGHETHGVGEKTPNAYGLYDMLGNVWEWCYDWYQGYDLDDLQDPSGPENGAGRVRRGGSWCGYAWSCRSAYRIQRAPGYRGSNIGFRLVTGQV